MRCSNENKRLLGASLVLIGLIGLLSLSVCQAQDDTKPGDAAPIEQSARARFILPRLFDFERYKSAFNKHYASLIEEAARARLFLGRAFRAFVSAVSYKQRRTSSYLAINHMSDWTPAEVRSTHMRPQIRPPVQVIGHDEMEQVPAVSLDEVKEELGEIVEQADEQADNLRRLIAEELSKPAAGQLRRRRQAETSSKSRELAIDDIFREPNGEATSSEAGQRIESNNPHYEPPELISFGSSLPAVQSTEPLTGQAGEQINNTPGMGFINWVLTKASEVWTFMREDIDDLDDEARTKQPPANVPLPDEVFIDLRDDCMFAVRNQGRCGSCYAFASIAVYEWLYCKATGKKVALSEQYIVDCGSKFDLDGCEGGYTHMIPMFVRSRGLELRANYPYRERTDQCPYKPATPESAMGYLRVSTNSLRDVYVKNFERELKKGPLVISLFPSGSFSEYGGGVDSGYDCDKLNGAHAITLVGSGREDNDEYWLLRNSYSPLWGEQGYYKLSKKSSKRCIEDQQAYQLTGLKVQNKEGVNDKYQPEHITQRYKEYIVDNKNHKFVKSLSS